MFRQYIPASGKGVNELKVETYYSLGGMNYFNGKAESRGYYISVIPQERIVKDGYVTIGTTCFAGVKKLLVPVDRKNKKKEAEADELGKTLVDKLVADVCARNGIALG